MLFMSEVSLSASALGVCDPWGCFQPVRTALVAGACSCGCAPLG
jgi:hypothetical protein